MTDAGYIFCPFVPLTQTPVVLDPESFRRPDGIMERYSEERLREGARYYSGLVLGETEVLGNKADRCSPPKLIDWKQFGF